jgi:hypothetical protein
MFSFRITRNFTAGCPTLALLHFPALAWCPCSAAARLAVTAHWLGASVNRTEGSPAIFLYLFCLGVLYEHVFLLLFRNVLHRLPSRHKHVKTSSTLHITPKVCSD